MPGANCLFPGCTNSRYKKKEETPEEGTTSVTEPVRFFKIQTRKGQFYQNWRNEVLAIVKRYREDLDPQFYAQIYKSGKFICNRHYSPEDTEMTDGTN